jgi:hypothetical protein
MSEFHRYHGQYAVLLRSVMEHLETSPCVPFIKSARQLLLVNAITQLAPESRGSGRR